MAKPLRGSPRGEWRLRVGNYRVLHRIDDAARVVTITDVGTRGSIYGK
jgi:mRNA-degrading endonuclease RelE of RelBE toxin-antitoxin system